MPRTKTTISNNNHYGNFEVQNKYGELIFYCRKDRFQWYLDRDLGVKIADKVLRLNFETNGMGHKDDPCLLQKFENKCVVCGLTSELTVHHLVPYRYRRYLRHKVGYLTHFDCLLVCKTCHRKYNTFENQFNKELIQKYNIQPSLKFVVIPELAKARKSAAALLMYSDKIPQYRKEFLLGTIRKYKNQEIFTKEDLKAIMQIDYHYPNSLYKSEGQEMIEQVSDLDEFAREWRRHFLITMNPKYLPANWNPEIRDANGRLI